MPTYEYLCSACQRRFDVFQSIKADPLTNCPECDGPVERQISAGAGIIFKGSGFYQTDYKKSSPPSSAVEKTPEGKGAKSADTKSADTKSADTKKSDTKKSGSNESGGASASKADSP